MGNMMEEKRFSRRVIRKIIELFFRLIFSFRKSLVFKNEIEIESPCVIVVYHGEMLPVLQKYSNTNSVFLTSTNHVGGTFAKILKGWGYDIIHDYSRRAKEKNTLEALQEKIKEGKNIILTPDGSRGPRHKMKAGAIVLAKRENVPLYLVTPIYKGIRLRFLWDKFLLPYPKAIVEFKYSKMRIAQNATREEVEKKILEAEKILEGQ